MKNLRNKNGEAFIVVILVLVLFVAILLTAAFMSSIDFETEKKVKIYECPNCDWNGTLENCTVETDTYMVPQYYYDGDSWTVYYIWHNDYYYYCPVCEELIKER